MKSLFVLVFFLIINSLVAQKTIENNFWNPNSNPTNTIAESNYIHTSINNRYLIKDWNDKSVTAAFQIKHGTFVSQITQQGNYRFSKSNYAFGYAKSLSPNLRMGMILNYTTFKQLEEFDSPSVLSPSFGFHYKIDAENHLYGSAINSWEGNTETSIPNTITLNWNHTLNSNAILIFGIHSNPLGIKGFSGFDYSFNSNFELYFKVSTSEAPFENSIVYNVNRLSIFQRFQFHNQLGFSNKLGIGYLW